MKSFKGLFAGTILIIVSIFVIMNLYFFMMADNEKDRNYRIEINRLYQEILNNGTGNVKLAEYQWVKEIFILENGSDKISFFEGSNKDYVIKNINGVYYRFDYVSDITDEYRTVFLWANIAMGMMAFTVLMVLIYIYLKLIYPFHEIKEVPYELSKGNLTAGLKENKNRFFGKFVWGLNLLREKLEQQKEKELNLQKEKNTLVLSISHDIKTPLSAIKLYARALSKNLYESDRKRIQIADSISQKADEIEGFVSEIIKSSSEDFLNLEIQVSEFYIDDLMEKIINYYMDKLELLKIEFKIEHYTNCLVKGDIDRVVESLQNIIENAIKYGDGKCISISVSTEEDCRLITIKNSGCTLSENELPHIFDSFWRGSNAGNNSGSGLGLYICRQIMRKIDGDVFAECAFGEMKVTVVLRML